MRVVFGPKQRVRQAPHHQDHGTSRGQFHVREPRLCARRPKRLRTDRGKSRPYGFRSCRDLESLPGPCRSEEHTSELQSLMRISYAVFCLKKKNTTYSSKPSITPTQ